MSMLSLGRNGNGKAPNAPPLPPHVDAQPAPQPPGPHQLGGVTLANVDAITSLTAEEIERTAEQLMDAANETADTLREAARRVRHSGMVANERLSNTVRTMAACAEAARLMQEMVEERDQPQAQPEPEPAPAMPPGPAPKMAQPATDLDALARQIGMVPPGDEP
jgi:hypothetical protein